MDLYGPFHLGFVYALSTAVSVLAVFSGFIADVIGYKPIILVVPILIMFSFILFFTGDTSLWILLIVAVALHIPPLAGPAISALISNLVSSETLGMAFSFYRFLMLAGFTASSSALAFLTQYFGLKPVLALSIISLGICALLRFFIRSARPYTGIPTQRSGPRILDIIRSFKKYELFAIISFSTVNALALSYGPYLYNFIRDVIGLSILYMGLYESVTTIAPSLFQPVSGLIIDKFGCIATLKYALILESLIVSVISLLAYTKAGALVIIAVLLTLELFGALTGNSISVSIAEYSARRHRATAYGFLTTLSSLIAMPLYMYFAGVWSVNPVILPLSYGVALLAPLAVIVLSTHLPTET